MERIDIRLFYQWQVALSFAAQRKWGEAENAMKYWAEKISQWLTELQTAGTIK